MTAVMNDLAEDVSAVSRLTVVPRILEAVCKVTGMGFSAIARVTPDKWMACAVRDDIRFGLLPGGELNVETTICHEIRQSGEGVVIDHVAADFHFAGHHTPAMYGFKSYISLPIVDRHGRFFGTLCAIDPSPAVLNTPAIIGLFRQFSALISLHLALGQESDPVRTADLECNTLVQLDKLLLQLPAASPNLRKEVLEERLAPAIATLAVIIAGLDAEMLPAKVLLELA